jgi:protein TonB
MGSPTLSQQIMPDPTIPSLTERTQFLSIGCILSIILHFSAAGIFLLVLETARPTSERGSAITVELVTNTRRSVTEPQNTIRQLTTQKTLEHKVLGSQPLRSDPSHKMSFIETTAAKVAIKRSVLPERKLERPISSLESPPITLAEKPHPAPKKGRKLELSETLSSITKKNLTDKKIWQPRTSPRSQDNTANALVSKRATSPRLKEGKNNKPPIYPRSARRQGLAGKVVLLATVGSNGLVQSLQVKRSSGTKILDEAAYEAIKTWRFIPATLGGITVEGKITIPIVFKLRD